MPSLPWMRKTPAPSAALANDAMDEAAALEGGVSCNADAVSVSLDLEHQLEEEDTSLAEEANFVVLPRSGSRSPWANDAERPAGPRHSEAEGYQLARGDAPSLEIRCEDLEDGDCSDCEGYVILPPTPTREAAERAQGSPDDCPAKPEEVNEARESVEASKSTEESPQPELPPAAQVDVEAVCPTPRSSNCQSSSSQPRKQLPARRSQATPALTHSPALGSCVGPRIAQAAHEEVVIRPPSPPLQSRSTSGRSTQSDSCEPIRSFGRSLDDCARPFINSLDTPFDPATWAANDAQMWISPDKATNYISPSLFWAVLMLAIVVLCLCVAVTAAWAAELQGSSSARSARPVNMTFNFRGRWHEA